MKKVLITLIFASIIILGYSQTNSDTRYQQGYYKKDGTYVQGHEKTVTNETNHDNYSTKDNTNNYTNKKGYRAKDNTPAANNYGKGKEIKEGPKGGQYYTTPKETKVYVPKRDR